ncbi:MAG: hypothetical protein ABIR21_08270 [Chthoniobacterales bacterium]
MPGPFEVRRADGDTALVIDDLRHLRMRWRREQGREEACAKDDETVDEVHKVIGFFGETERGSTHASDNPDRNCS